MPTAGRSRSVAYRLERSWAARPHRQSITIVVRCLPGSPAPPVSTPPASAAPPGTTPGTVPAASTPPGHTWPGAALSAAAPPFTRNNPAPEGPERVAAPAWRPWLDLLLRLVAAAGAIMAVLRGLNAL